MARGSRQTSSNIENAIKTKANYNVAHNNFSLGGSSGGGNPVTSGHMNGSSLVLSLEDGSNVTIPDVEIADAYDHFILNSINDFVTQTEANTDWNNL